MRMDISESALDFSEQKKRSHPRVLIIAENASLSIGGEAILPVQWFVGLAKEGVEAHLLVHSRCKAELIRELPQLRERMHFVPEKRLQTIVWKLGSRLPPHVRDFTTGWVVHLISQFMQRRAARVMVAKSSIDIIHQPTPVSPRLPSMLHGLGVPVIIGPMNGNMTYPPGSASIRPISERIFVPVARFFSGVANRVIPGKLRAEMLLVANERTKQAISRSYRGSVEVFCENGVDPQVWRMSECSSRHDVNRLRLVFVGRLERWKGPSIALQAFGEVKEQRPDAELWIIGDGPEMGRLKNEAKTMGLIDAVNFFGWLSREQCLQMMSQSDVMVFPSIHDCGGAVVLEAMAMGLPVVAVNWGGPSDYLAKGGGILINPSNHERMAAEIAKVILGLTPAERNELGTVAQKIIIEHYTWPSKVRKIIDIYRSVCEAYRQSLGVGKT